MNFTERTKERLASYKASTFPGLSDGIWKKNKKSYPHILPEDNKIDNLLPQYTKSLQIYMNTEKVHLHSDFHHLNSSQAMCLNFFFPLYYERSLEVITEFFGFKEEKVNYLTVKFEKRGLEAELGSRQPTSFDFYFETFSGKKFYFEIKYTEGEFGKDSQTDPAKRKIKFDKYYSSSISALNELYHDSESFSEHYQIFRNLVHIGDNSFVFFIFPHDNVAVRSQAEKVKNDFLAGAFKKQFYFSTWEQLFKEVWSSTITETLQSHLEDFKLKYFGDK